MSRIRLFAVASCFACFVAVAGCSEKRSVAPPAEAAPATADTTPAADPTTDEGDASATEAPSE